MAFCQCAEVQEVLAEAGWGAIRGISAVQLACAAMTVESEVAEASEAGNMQAGLQHVRCLIVSCTLSALRFSPAAASSVQRSR
jgi:hypothetical protein